LALFRLLAFDFQAVFDDELPGVELGDLFLVFDEFFVVAEDEVARQDFVKGRTLLGVVVDFLRVVDDPLPPLFGEGVRLRNRGKKRFLRPGDSRARTM
jgi:hypothetical protein